MVSKVIKVENSSGLHVRPAGILVKVIQPFACNVSLKFNEKEYNAKSILGIMSAGIKAGASVEFVCDGADEQEALDAIEKAILSGLGE